MGKFLFLQCSKDRWFLHKTHTKSVYFYTLFAQKYPYNKQYAVKHAKKLHINPLVYYKQETIIKSIPTCDRFLALRHEMSQGLLLSFCL